jgi:hypothetical protein
MAIFRLNISQNLYLHRHDKNIKNIKLNAAQVALIPVNSDEKTDFILLLLGILLLKN